MFKVAFVYPAYENLGIEYLSAGLKIRGFDTKLFLDPIIFSESGFVDNKLLGRFFSFRKYILKEIINYQPDLICFSVITDNYIWACEWASEIKKYLDAPIIFGGIHPTSVPDRVIREQFVDYVCVGEGDFAIVELAEALRDKKSTVNIQNIWADAGSSAFRNQVRPPIQNLDTLPFPDKDLYYSVAPIFNDGYLVATSRGCPFNCAYCCNNIYRKLYKDFGVNMRRRSVNNVLEELKYAKNRYKIKFVHFVDDVFNFDENWLLSFLEEYKQKIDLPFSCYIYPNLINPTLVNCLRQAGCFKVQMGFQVIDKNKRESVLGRHYMQDEVGNIIDSFKKSGIFVVCDNIFGFPDEKEEELASLCNFYNEHTPSHCEIFWLRYYPKTEITMWALKNNYIDLSKNEEIEKGNFNFGLFKKREHITSKSYSRQLMFLLYIFPFLPKKLRIFIFVRKIYRFFPQVSSLSLMIITRILNHPKFDFNTIRTVRRYIYFCIKKPIF